MGKKSRNFVIYPSGYNGRRIGLNLEILFPQSNILYIDDSQESTSLSSQHHRIDSSFEVMIVSSNHAEILKSKLCELGITKTSDGLSYCAKEINKRIADFKTLYSFKKIVALSIVNQTEIKHLVDLDNELRNRGVGIVYFVSPHISIEEFEKKGLVFILSESLVEQIDELDMILTTGGTWVNEKVMAVDMTHHYQGALHFPFTEGLDWDSVRRGYINVDYVLCGSKKIERSYRELFKFLDLNTQTLALGYPKLEGDIECYHSCSRGDQEANGVVLAFNYLMESNHIIPLAQAIIQTGYKVYYLPHPTNADRNETALIGEFFKDNKRFFIIENSLDRMTIFHQSFCCLSDVSSMGYTFPLTALKPCVIITGNTEEYFAKRIGNEHYFEPDLHLPCRDYIELPNVLMKIKQDEEGYQKRIKGYREENCFNLGRAREKIIDWLLEKLEIKE